MKTKRSSYNVVHDFGDGYLIVVNTVSGACIKIKKETYYDLENCSDASLHDTCVKNGFLVEDTLDEEAFVRFVRYANNISNSDTCSFVVLPTTSCNARCFYCYEEVLKYETMTEKTAIDTAKYILKTAGESNIRLMWFGGEPLMAKRIISIISKMIMQGLSIDQKYSSTMITNASLIDDGVIDSMVNEWNISRVQITLDGFEEEYKKRKNYRQSVDFNRIIDNINILLSKRIQVAIRLNFDKNNFDEIVQLISFLGDKVSNKELASVYAIPLFPPNANCSAADFFKADELDKQYFVLYEKMLENGFITSLKYFTIFLKSHFCGAMKSKHAVICPDGRIYKCQHVNSEGNMPVGDIYSGIKFCYNNTKWVDPQLSKECDVCVFLPVCQGGCRIGDTEKGVLPCCLFRYTKDSTLHTIGRLQNRR